MLKLRISGTKNDLKTFQKWLKRVSKNDSLDVLYIMLVSICFRVLLVP